MTTTTNRPSPPVLMTSQPSFWSTAKPATLRPAIHQISTTVRPQPPPPPSPPVEESALAPVPVPAEDTELPDTTVVAVTTTSTQQPSPTRNTILF